MKYLKVRQTARCWPGEASMKSRTLIMIPSRELFPLTGQYFQGPFEVLASTWNKKVVVEVAIKEFQKLF